MLKENIVQVLAVCKSHHIHPGEANQIVVKVFGNTFENLPDNRLDEIKDWFAMNYYRAFEILEPEKHSAIMKMDSTEARKYKDFYYSRGAGGKGIADKKQTEQLKKYWQD
jgi:hypothetical protein